MREPAPKQTETVLLDHVSADGPQVLRVRGTLLVASLNVVRHAGLYDQYTRELPKEYEQTVLYSLASSWLPVEAVLAHYETCERLGLSDALIERNAARVGERLGETFMANLMRSARLVGMSDVSWTVLKQSGRVWDRVFAGGRCQVICTGPKDATLEFTGLPLAQCRYYRVAHLANMRALVGLFTKKGFVRAVRSRHPHPTTIAVGLSWV